MGPRSSVPARPTLGSAFASGPNAFSAVRLLLAMGVLVWHCVWITGASVGWPDGITQFVKQWAVDGFFVLSGFLIVASWQRRPEPVPYLLARAGRLLPAFWVCLAVTAFLVAPVSAGPRDWGDQVRYVVTNLFLVRGEPGVGNSPGGVSAGIWNISLWSLPWEAFMYLAVLALGITGRLVVPVLVIVVAESWLWILLLVLTGTWAEVSGIGWLLAAPRLSMMFALGGLAWMLRARVPASGGWLALSAVVLAAATTTGAYQLVAAPALAHLVLVGGVRLGHFRWLRLREDISYGLYLYGFPVQLALLASPVATLGLPTLVVCTTAISAVLAWISWRCVEKPVMAVVKARTRRVRPAVAEAEAVGGSAYP